MKFFTTTLIVLCLGMFYSQSRGQTPLNDYTFNAGYFGNNFWNEGIKLGVERPIHETTKYTKKGKERMIMKNHSLSLNMYRDNDSHSAVFVTAGWSKKKIFTNRFNFTTSAEPFGLYRSFLPETYKVKDDGSIKQVFLPGRFYLAPSVSAGIGRRGRWHPENGWYTRVNLTTLLPYNRSVMPLLNVEFGYHFKLLP